MSRGSRRGRRTQSSVLWSTGSCPSGKREYPSRRSAKVHSARLRSQGVREYQCEQCGAWHVGHLPARVRRGELTATEHYQDNRRPAGLGPSRAKGSPVAIRPDRQPAAKRSAR